MLPYKSVICALVALTLVPVFGQQESAPPQAQAYAETKPANPADVKSMDAIIAAVYDVISGPAGKARDWDRFRSLFLPGARLIPTGPRPNGESGIHVLTPEEYVSNAGPYLEKNGFYEHEIARRADSFGNITQVFSTYESRHKPDEAPFSRGINSIQLTHDDQRWWIVTIMWDSERPGNPIPDKYLKSRTD